MKKLLAVAAVAFLGLSGAVLSQTIAVPQVSIINPNDLLQVVPHGQPSAQSVYATPAQITSQSGYVKASPTAGSAGYTFANSQSYLVFTSATLLATQTITLAPGPSDGAYECIYAQNGVTTLTINANTGQSINNAVTTLAAAAKACYLFSVSNNTWDRS